MPVENLQGEIWKDIPGYEGLYQASNIGRIKNYNRDSLLTPNENAKGYYHVTLHIDGKPKTFKWHRIIAIAFLQRHHSKPQINHKNGIKTDNRVENLEWCDHSYNQRHAYDKGLNYGKKGKLSPIYGRVRGLSPKAKLVLDTNTGIFYDCIKDAADAKDIPYGMLKDRLQGRITNNTGLVYG